MTVVGNNASGSIRWSNLRARAERLRAHSIAGAMPPNRKEFIAIEIIAPARMRLYASFGIKSMARPMPAKIKENSPICAKLMPTVIAVLSGYLKSNTKATAASVLPTVMIKITISNLIGSFHTISGLRSMPTETKKRTANASRNGRDSSAARLLNSDSPSIIPAKNAPKANETSNSEAAKNAIPIADAITASVKSSRDPFFATSHKILGRRRLPTTSIKTINAVTLAKVMPTACNTSI